MKGSEMKPLSYTQFQSNPKTYFDAVTNDGEPIVVKRKENKNIVILSEKTYCNLLENLYITSFKSNYDWLMESISQLEQDRFKGDSD